MPQWPMSLAIVALPMAANAAAFKYHDVTATFVSADPKGKRFTVTLDDGSTNTGTAEGEALAVLRRLKRGDKIAVTCKDMAQGHLIAATSIRVVR